jgi:opacity protein-like surface antigen
MGSLKTVAFTAAAMVALVPASKAADMPPPLAPPPVIDDFASGWYLRGDIGMSNQKVRRLDNALFASTAGLVIVDKSFDSAPFFGLGIGYHYNNWLRFDLTGEYRGGASFHGLDVYGGPPATNTNVYTGIKSEWLFLLNAYVDLGTWVGVTPFVGAGIGTSWNRISNFRDVDPTIPSVAYAASDGQWNLAWALHAGLSYAATPNLSIELAYRYLSLGDAKTGDIIAFDGTNPNVNPMHFKGLTSHDLKLGMRWRFADYGGPEWRQPIVRKY